MDGSQNLFALSTNQQTNSENIEKNVSCNISARTFLASHGLLQHLNFCQRRNRTNKRNQTIATGNDNNDNTSNNNNSNDNDKIRLKVKKSFTGTWWQEVLSKMT